MEVKITDQVTVEVQGVCLNFDHDQFDDDGKLADGVLDRQLKQHFTKRSELVKVKAAVVEALRNWWLTEFPIEGCGG